MRTLKIGRTELPVKDYRCALCGLTGREETDYSPEEEPKLWLYVVLTDSCNADCPFCVNRSSCGADAGAVTGSRFEEVLTAVGNRLSGVSFTGGEPMLFPEKLEMLLEIVSRVIPEETEVDMVTNGTGLGRLASIRGLERVATIHISRHAVSDARNRELMRWAGAPSEAELREAVRSLPDPGAAVLNCVLQKGGVEDPDGLADYLEMALRLGVRNTSFISMFQANGFCRTHTVRAEALLAELREWNASHAAQFRPWNRFRDHGICSCLTGDYRSGDRSTQFYFRIPGEEKAGYCRQLVYRPGDVLRDGFGADAKILIGPDDRLF